MMTSMMKAWQRTVSALLALVSAALLAYPAELWAATFHVSPNGSDSGPGTSGQPFATVYKAAETAQAGDEVLLHDGVYRITREVRPRHSGTADRWIVYRAAPGEKPVIDAQDFIMAGTNGVPPSRRQLGAFHLEEVSFVRVHGLTVRNAHFAGFNVLGSKTHHIELLECRSERSYGPGIFLRSGPEHVRVMGCEITGANDPELRTAVERPPREAPHEALSIAWARHFEIASNHVHHCVKEGIDCKETSAHGTIHHNLVHDVRRQGLYVDCWFGLLEDVEFHSNTAYSNEWGLVISAEGRGARMQDVRIHHNLIHDNRASGIYFGTWGVNGPRSDIAIYHNTIVRNGHVRHWAGATGGIDLRAQDLRRIAIVNNIVFDNAAYEIATFAEPDQQTEILTASEILISNNLTGPFRNLSSEGGSYNRPYAYRGEQIIEADPKFVNPAAGDFHLQPGSPAIGAAKKLIPADTDTNLGGLP